MRVSGYGRTGLAKALHTYNTVQNSSIDHYNSSSSISSSSGDSGSGDNSISSIVVL